MTEVATAFPLTDPALLFDWEHFSPYTYYPTGKCWSFCRGVDKTAGKISTKYDSISQYLVDIITSPFDQDVSALFVGNKGSGKSSTVLSICYHAAIKIADWVNDGSKWDDYYNLHELTACILEDDANKLMNIQRKYVIKNFDDIGLGWGARNWRDDENIQKNDIFQINRTDSAMQFFSIPNQFLLDKVPRSLVSHYVEMDDRMFDLGFTTIKLFKPKTMFRESKIINPFLIMDRNKYVNYLIPKPPHKLWSEYKELRAKNKDIAIRRRQEDKNKRDEMRQLQEEVKMQKLVTAKIKDQERVKKISQTEIIHKEWEAKFREDVIPDLIHMAAESTKPLDKCLNLACRKHGLEGSATAYFRREKFLEKYDIAMKVEIMKEKNI